MTGSQNPVTFKVYKKINNYFKAVYRVTSETLFSIFRQIPGFPDLK